MLTLLTATGMRPTAWDICEQLMASQTFTGDVRWIIVDDGAVGQGISVRRRNWEYEIIRPFPRWSVGENTQTRNLRAGMMAVGPDEQVVIIEDDDYYDPQYLVSAEKWLRRSNLAGEGRARYYNVATGMGRQMANTQHCSLCSTVMKGDALEVFSGLLLKERKFIDIELWKMYKGARDIYPARHVVGIKGLPGRPGIGSGHVRSFGTPMKLEEWIEPATAKRLYAGFRA